ncbi:uncharacterized protein BXZ73DRAFT_91971 [Epithele typhae]|uniref:uncharacterized protein n=1 Tax=Epithele typhae TaxID=378194 RepID=UPI002008251A|nr:uncharacterized protein BXZ73DRAFT_91971 [Epithele typhae]KAH9920241.1 hypothetical protein BXZ73DRAFT_91971 [Epithele typhae]
MPFPWITREHLRQAWRLLTTLAVPLILGLLSRKIFGEPKEEVPVTAVILNWSRFPNVMLIASLMCAPWMENTIAQVFIWNNSPAKLRYEEFKNSGCTRSKLTVYNAPKNMLFQARHLACAQVETPYCFVQDDDYLVPYEIIESLHVRISDLGAANTIHLLPPHEHLSTKLREIHVPAPDDTHLSDIHTSFAWLGHGTMMHRSEARKFVTLLRSISATSDEMKMADNFFTLLSNRVPEVWLDQMFELGGGEPFTVGPEGDERNRNFTLRAANYLASLAHCGRTACEEPMDLAQGKGPQLPYIALDRSYEPTSWTSAACRGASCVLDTNIRTLPAQISREANSITDIFALEEKNLEVLGEAGKDNYLQYAPSNAVDMKSGTVFRSLTHAAQGDTIVIDVLTDISEAREWTAIELAWLVDSATEEILKASVFEWSTDKEAWHAATHAPLCYDTGHMATIGEEQIGLRECSVQMILGSSALHLRATGRYFRARLEDDRADRWTISEVWLRGF